jgi:hypothetical protein
LLIERRPLALQEFPTAIAMAAATNGRARRIATFVRVLRIVDLPGANRAEG